MNEFRVARLTGEVNPTPPDRLVGTFEDHYRRFMEYEYTEGRLREVDLAKMSKMAGLEADPKTAAFIHEAQTRRAEAKAARAPITILADDPELSKAWETMLDESIAITDRTTDAELVAILRDLGNSPADLADRLATRDDQAPNERFEWALAELSWEERVELVSALKGTKSIHVYRRTGT
ncbi:hypothetical protein EON77_09740 [bacterium]|nr:MAG: hypothetical protein EON77_09740 [bacterium]